MKVPWSNMKAGDIANWPLDVKFAPIYKMNTNDLKKLHQLAKKDLLDFTPEFISQFKITHDSVDELRSYVAKNLGGKLARKLNVSSMRVPWSNMKVEDIINWPPDVKFKRIGHMNSTELKRLHQLAKKDLLDFTPEFLSKFKIITKSVHELRADFTKYLADKLAKKLNVSSIKIPWSSIREADIINWPPEVKFAPIYKMGVDDLEKLYVLVTQDLLDFSPNFLEKSKTTFKPTNDRDELRTEVLLYMKDKISKKINMRSNYFSWAKLKAGDIMNWPPDLKFAPINTMNTNEVKKLHELVKKDILDFSPGLITRLREEELLKSKSAMPEFQEIIRDIETALCNKLNAGTNKNFDRVPWAILKTEDVYNWPAGVRFIRLSQLGKKHLRLLHKLRDVIFFSKEFLQRLSDPSFDKTPIGKLIISRHKSQT
jgi:DICT domain-containing protein